MNKIQHSLTKIFEKERVVLWYAGEEEVEMHRYFSELEMEGIEKIRVENNEFAVKYRVLREAPKQQFLIFIPTEQPADLDNWLLDICLANHVFSTDESAIYLQELGLEISFKPIIQAHLPFFKSKERLAALRRIVNPKEDKAEDIRYKLLAVVAKTEPVLEAILMNLIGELATGKEGQLEQIEKYKLADFLWQELERQYGYSSESRTVLDFVKALFLTEASVFLPNQKARLNRESVVFMRRWKDSARNRLSFEHFSNRLAKEWDMEKDLATVTAEDLAEADLFEMIDQKILTDLRQGILSGTIPLQNANELIAQREQKYWYEKYQYHYSAIQATTDFFEQMRTVDFGFGTVGEALDNYVKHYYKIDWAYRRWGYAFRESGNSSVLAAFSERMEREYGNNFLLKLNDCWQAVLDKSGSNVSDTSEGIRYVGQRQFWKKYIAPYVEKENRIFVIISDALRYESGADLCERLLRESRFEANLESMTASIPTYTQMGMAALLPHKELELTEKGVVLADRKSTQGTANRDKILKATTEDKGVAVKAEDFLKEVTPKQKGRDWVKPFNVVYIYSNTIDKAGEEEEEKLFQRTEEEMEHLIKIIRKITSINGNNVIITADHGYLYQIEAVAESDFANFTVEGNISKMNRRFVIGRNLNAPKGVMHFQPEDLNLEGDLEIVIPKSVNRLRQKGSGSRYVHGGMSLQELVIPVIQFSKKRTSETDAKSVEVDLIQTTRRITSNQIVLSFYQKQAVQAKWLPKEMRLGFYDRHGRSISDETTVKFDSEATAERQRETKVAFHFTQLAEESHNRDVYLRMEDVARGKYDEISFKMMISFTSDFDF